MRYFLELSYNGKNYHGWQIQPNAISIQETLNKCLSKILIQEIYVLGAGRTDTGVHSEQMFCHFDIEKEIHTNFLYKINRVLPKDIYIKDFFKVKNEVHSRFDAIKRSYKYVITQKKDPFLLDFSYHFTRKLDIVLMNKACKILKRNIDFKCFSKNKTQVNNFNCKITKAKWVKKGSTIVFYIEADRFLRNMVRAIVGTMLDIGERKISLLEFKEILKSKNRSEAGTSVTPKGLFLYKIEYPKNIKL